MASKYLNIIKLTVYFSEAEAFEIEQHDLFEVFAKLGFDVLNIVTIKKNSYFVVTQTPSDAIEIFKKLNNHFIDALKAHILVQLCIEAEDLNSIKGDENFRCVFEVEVPDLNYFDVKKRFMGVDDYNFERLKNLCEKEFFEGVVLFEFRGIEKDIRTECQFPH